MWPAAAFVTLLCWHSVHVAALDRRLVNMYVILRSELQRHQRLIKNDVRVHGLVHGLVHGHDLNLLRVVRVTMNPTKLRCGRVHGLVRRFRVGFMDGLWWPVM